MFLLTARIVAVLRTNPVQGKNWLSTALLHGSLYLFMVFVPLSGYFYSNTAGRSVAFFGLPLPDLFAANKPLAELAGNVHGWLAYTFLAFITLHILVHRKQISGYLRRWQRATT